MNITFSPQGWRDTSFSLKRLSADTLELNGEIYDFSQVEEGDELPAEATGSPWFLDKVTRVSGELRITLLMPIPVYDSTPTERFPEPISGDIEQILYEVLIVEGRRV